MADMIAMYDTESGGKLIGRACLAGWMAAVITGMILMARYQMTPAKDGAGIVVQWPAKTSVQRDSNRLTLIMALHPRCPCSRASVAELSSLVARANGRLTARPLRPAQRRQPGLGPGRFMGRGGGHSRSHCQY